MSKISIRRQHQKSDVEVREIAEQLTVDLDSQYGLKSSWDGDSVNFERTGLKGVLQLNPGEVAIDMKLGMMMSGFSNNIEKALNKALDKKLS